jgi:hypothetical protein
MTIATQISMIRQKLEQARLSYRRGEAQLCELHRLDELITALLPHAQGTSYHLTLQCMKGVVISLQTRTLQQQGLTKHDTSPDASRHAAVA